MKYYETNFTTLYCGDCLNVIENENLHFDKVITSPPITSM